ncbi:MAG: phage tail tip lysozyme [Candidatus Saccharibacteria bacterium]|nr:phage tail tip lysozyme [Candidatus Saccharibacteria bacterium]
MYNNGMGFLKKSFVVLVTILVFSVSSNSVFALSSDKYNLYSQNSIFFFDPEASNPCKPSANGGTMVPVSPDEVFLAAEDNPHTVLANLMNHGYTQEAAAGIVGNLIVESGVAMSPKILQGGSFVDDDFRAWDNGGKTFKGGFGIVQWTAAERVQGLQEYADSRSLPVTSLEAQVGFLLEELENPDYKSTLDDLNGKSVEEATFMVGRWFERPGDFIWTTHDGKYYNSYRANTYEEMNPTDTPALYRNFSNRLKFAQQFVGAEPTGVPSETAVNGVGSVVNCLPEVVAPTGTSIGGVDGVVSFLQCDPQWGDLNYGPSGVNGYDSGYGDICQAGCGPVSFASILANFGMNVSPIEVVNVAGIEGMHVAGSGSSHQITQVLAEHYGLEYTSVNYNSIDEINELLKSGYMIHVVGKGSAPYSSGGHYIAIVGIADDGNWIIADSSRPSAAAAIYSPSVVASQAHAGGAVRRK